MPSLWNELARKGRSKFAERFPRLMEQIKAEYTQEVAKHLSVDHEELTQVEYNKKLYSLIAAAADGDESIYLIELGSSTAEEARLGVADYKAYVNQYL